MFSDGPSLEAISILFTVLIKHPSQSELKILRMRNSKKNLLMTPPTLHLIEDFKKLQI